jgi:hypothetical protein
MRHRASTRAAMAAFLLLTLSAATAVSFHSHEHDSSRACQVCHAANLPALTTVARLQLSPLAFLAWHVPQAGALLYPDPFSGNSHSRAPPA